MKYIKLFEKTSDYQAFKESADYIEPNVSYSIDTDVIHYNPYIPPPPKAGDVVYYANGTLNVTPLESYSSSMGTAVGVIVVPSGMLPDGKARMIGLHGANNNSTCIWGPSSTDTSLPNLDTVPTTDNAGSTTTGSNTYGYLPSDNFTGAQSFVDPQAKYKGSTPYIPSPYLADGSLNPEFTKSSLANNALADFNGKSNTDTLVALGSSYTAANAAKNYSVEGIDIDWYLPACGELAFLPVRYKAINDSIVALGGTSVPHANFWSSSEYSSLYARSVDTGTGFVYGYGRSNGSYVRAFAIIDDNGGVTPTIITFTISETEYQAEEGMTWEEWCNSKYNNDGWTCGNYGLQNTVLGKNVDVQPADVIIPNFKYVGSISGGSGN